LCCIHCCILGLRMMDIFYHISSFNNNYIRQYVNGSWAISTKNDILKDGLCNLNILRFVTCVLCTIWPPINSVVFIDGLIVSYLYINQCTVNLRAIYILHFPRPTMNVQDKWTHLFVIIPNLYSCTYAEIQFVHRVVTWNLARKIVIVMPSGDKWLVPYFS